MSKENNRYHFGLRLSLSMLCVILLIFSVLSSAFRGEMLGAHAVVQTNIKTDISNNVRYGHVELIYTGPDPKSRGVISGDYTIVIKPTSICKVTQCHCPGGYCSAADARYAEFPIEGHATLKETYTSESHKRMPNPYPNVSCNEHKSGEVSFGLTGWFDNGTESEERGGFAVSPDMGSNSPDPLADKILHTNSCSDGSDNFQRTEHFDIPDCFFAHILAPSNGYTIISTYPYGICKVTLGGPPTKDPCDNVNEGIKYYTKGPWNFGYQIIKGKGLVLTGITAGTKKVFDGISVPHFKIEYGQGKSKIIRFCTPNDPNNPTTFDPSPTIAFNLKDNSHSTEVLKWSFSKEFKDQTSDIKGKLIINYQVFITTIATNCEANLLECYRVIPSLSYSWVNEGSYPTIKFTAFYKLDYGPNVGLALTHDVDTFVPFLFTNAGRQPILTTETKFEAVTKGQVGQIDNIHTVHVGQSVFLPGCRILSVFDCVHMHWRWSAITFGKRVDPMVNPITDNPITDEKLRGTPYLASNQDINIIVVKYHAGEDDPDDPLTLVNNEQIATTTYGGSTLSPTTGICDCILATADHPIVWYVASSTSDTNQEPFFAHGFFVLDTSKLPNKQAHSVPKNTAPVPNTSPNSSSPITLNPSLIAQNQSITTNKDTSMDIKLRANDSSDPNANLTGIIARQPVHGTLSSINQQTGTVTYTPQSSYVGNDSFTFKVNDGKSDSVSVGTVSIEVSNTLSNSSSLQSLPQHDNNNNSNDSGNSNIPTANNASVTTNMNTPIDMTLSGSDANPNANLSAAIVTNPSQGKLSEINQTTGVATYTPQPNYVGNDSFTFKVNDGKSDSRNVGTVSINISRSMAPSLQPSSQNNISATANMASVKTYMNTPVDISLSASDPNPNANLTASIITQTAHGTLSELNQAAGRVTYTPNQNYTGQDSFTYKVNDGISDSNDARVYITVK